jgi:hypothetical protein
MSKIARSIMVAVIVATPIGVGFGCSGGNDTGEKKGNAAICVYDQVWDIVAPVDPNATTDEDSGVPTADTGSDPGDPSADTGSVEGVPGFGTKEYPSGFNVANCKAAADQFYNNMMKSYLIASPDCSKPAAIDTPTCCWLDSYHDYELAVCDCGANTTWWGSYNACVLAEATAANLRNAACGLSPVKACLKIIGK